MSASVKGTSPLTLFTAATFTLAASTAIFNATTSAVPSVVTVL
jgi:hypothetical protein